MRAAFIEQTGPPEVIKVGELPRPVPGPGQVLLRVHAVALNPIDLYIRSGLVAMPLSFPYIIGCDVAGTVEETGAGCTRFRKGDRVWGSNQGLLGRQGVAAEYVAVDEAWLYPTPALAPGHRGRGDGPGGDHGSSRPLPVRPAQRRVSWSTYPGGTGGVGSMVVQMAKAAGARVATAAGSPERLDLCRRLGADLALNYHSDDIPAQASRVFTRGSRRLVRNPARAEPRGLDPAAPQERPDDPDRRAHGQAGSSAGGLLPAQLRDLRVRHVQRVRRSAAPLCRRYGPLDRGRRLEADRRPRLPACRPPWRPCGSSKKRP